MVGARKPGPFAVIALVGPRAAGKTATGRALARRLGAPFDDTDDRIAAACGAPAGTFLLTAGEAAFRAAEERAVAEAFAFALAWSERQRTGARTGAAQGVDPVAPATTVLALGGGAILAPATRALCARADVFTVFVKADAAVLAARLRADPSPRPPLTGLSLEDEVLAVVAARLAFWREVADLEVDTGSLDPDAVAAAIAGSVAGSRGRATRDSGER